MRYDPFFNAIVGLLVAVAVAAFGLMLMTWGFLKVGSTIFFVGALGVLGFFAMFGSGP